MNRQHKRRNVLPVSVPRACGDEPIIRQRLKVARLRSPRMRG